MRILKSNPVLTIFNSYLVDSPQPSTISYLWNFGSLLGLCLISQIVSGILLAMHYQGSASFAFSSVEHIMRDVNDGWLIRMVHANIASFFFICVYLHISRGLYYGSYRSPRIGVWVIGTIIFFLMMATAFLGYVLPYGQMSLWGYQTNCLTCDICIILIIIRTGPYHNVLRWSADLITIYITPDIVARRLKAYLRIGAHNHDIMSLFYGSLLGDSHAERRRLGNGTRISFSQESNHSEYLLWLHDMVAKLGYYNATVPKVQTRLGIKGSLRYVLRFHTYTYTSLNPLHDDWYNNGIKRVPVNIAEFLTLLALAVWIMDDGARVRSGLKLCTNSFTYEDCKRLSSVLIDKYQLKVTV